MDNLIHSEPYYSTQNKCSDNLQKNNNSIQTISLLRLSMPRRQFFFFLHHIFHGMKMYIQSSIYKQ